MGYAHYEDPEFRDLRIRAHREAGFSYRQIAAIVGCSYSTVQEAIRPGAKRRYGARRRAYNTSPEGLERQRQYRLRKGQTAPKIAPK